MDLAGVTLEDKYTQAGGRIYVTGVQALVRLPMLQKARDRAAGLNTAGYISGYRGSPLGGYDRALWQAGRHLRTHDIHFQPGVNEDMAATALWGTQQLGLVTPTDRDGVFGLWYGKQPGVDRSGDPLKHGNWAGTAQHGGVVMLVGDDPAARSSTINGQSDLALIAHGIPVLNPADVQDALDLGLWGFALSRYSGCWVALRTVSETIEGAASVSIEPARVAPVVPADFEMPEGGLNIRRPDSVLAQEERLVRWRLPAARAFARANRLDRVVRDAPRRRLGLVVSGKSTGDTLEALASLGIDEALRAALGITVYKVAMAWPLETEGIRAWAAGHEAVMVIEEKRGVIEDQLARALYGLDRRPVLVGKTDEAGAPRLPGWGELDGAAIAPALADRILRLEPPEPVAQRLRAALQRPPSVANPIARSPWFCSGCPHNTSTHVPEGSTALAGIGCHTMAMWMPERQTLALTHMGGEGGSWIGMAPFSKQDHVFQNIGDGTYYHSGLLAIRAAVAAGVNITYKVLYNDAIAMTGGQPIDGPLSPADISRQLAAEGVKRIDVVTDEPGKYPPGTHWAPGVKIHHRDRLDRVQRDLRSVKGVTALIYDQTCAAEKRRRRKRGAYPDPARRVVINEAVCEGCGDCGTQSNCVSVLPVETEFGRKRTIDQASCNKDYSCLKGFCPSFVTVTGGGLRRPAPPATGPDDPAAGLAEPALPALDGPYNILVTGIGGTGVVTIAALLGMAAHMEGKGVGVLDNTGLAQKNGAVSSHIRIGAAPGELGATRIPAAGADLLLGCDMVVATSAEAMAALDAARSRAVVNDHVVPIGAFATHPDLDMNRAGTLDMLAQALGRERVATIDATRIAARVLGDAIAANPFLLGVAWQRGLVPVGLAALMRAIELNGVAVALNKRAFALGRRAAVEPEAVEAMATREAGAPRREEPARTLEEIVARRAAYLIDYQDAAYAARYAALVERVRAAEAPLGRAGLAEAVARSYFKLLAYKDEYEVARLLSAEDFRRRIAFEFEGSYRLSYHLAPPLLARRDPDTGLPLKSEYGAWVRPAFRLLAALKGLRGTPFDVFGYAAERRRERALIAEYEATMDELLAELRPETHGLAVAVAALPERIRGFGHIKQRSIAEAAEEKAALMARFRGAPLEAAAAE